MNLEELAEPARAWWRTEPQLAEIQIHPNKFKLPVRKLTQAWTYYTDGSAVRPKRGEDQQAEAAGWDGVW